MTTEIAIMNKSALALAADSAVTISVTGPQGRSHKVLNTANKLFALSKYAPVGLMVYGNAAMLGIPWETIVKMYREKVGDKVFPSLEGYARSFFRFLDDFPIDAELQGMYIASVATVWCKGLRQRVDQWVSDQFALDHQVTQEEIATTLRNLIDAEYQAALNEGKKSVLPNMTRSKLRRKYRERVARVITDIFENLPISAGMRTKILTIAVNFACVGLPNQSGVVIAGFGREDLFPCCCDFDVAAVFAGKAIRKSKRSEKITNSNAAVIMPFAQSHDVRTFMEGIGPGLNQFLREVFSSIFKQTLPDRVREHAGETLKLNNDQKRQLHKIIREMCAGACDEAFAALFQRMSVEYINPVVEATEYLNKAELAAMAETLVNLVSFRKQVTMEAETVGGPIDVAIISKGDGFVWVKRKHYFPPELNHHFFANYHKRVRSNGEETRQQSL